MFFVSPNGDYPMYPVDVQAVSPDWQVGDALPEGWLQAVIKEKPADIEGKITIYAEELEWIDGVPYQGWLQIDQPVIVEEPEVIE